MRVVIDTREQRPYEFRSPSVAGALAVGDYSLAGLEHLIAVERKEVNDLVGCLGPGRERFERELYRGRSLDYFALVIEASLGDLVAGRYRSEMSSQSVVQSLLAFSVRYRLPVFFAGSREHGQLVTEGLLAKYGREIERRYKALVATDGGGER